MATRTRRSSETTDAETLAAELVHKPGCPEAELEPSDERATRVETWTARSPRGQTITVVRCADCGEQLATPGAASVPNDDDESED